MRKVLGILSVLFVIVSCANASLVSESASYSGDTNFQETLSVAQFDNSLGTLNSVKLTFDGWIISSVGFENTNDGPYDADFFASLGWYSTISNSVTLNITGGSTTYLGVTENATSTAPNLDAYDGLTDYAGVSGLTEEIINENYQIIVTLTDPSELGGFTGSDFVDFTIDASNSGLSSLMGISSSFLSTQAGVSVLAEYDYTVPEPMTIALLGLGGLFIRRRKSA